MPGTMVQKLAKNTRNFMRPFCPVSCCPRNNYLGWHDCTSISGLLYRCTLLGAGRWFWRVGVRLFFLKLRVAGCPSTFLLQILLLDLFVKIEGFIVSPPVSQGQNPGQACQGRCGCQCFRRWQQHGAPCHSGFFG